MKRDSKPQSLEGHHALVYEGFLTRLFQDLSLATPYYTTVMRRLRTMGCVQQLSRGGGNSPSRWELVTEPTWEKFEEFENKRFQNNTKLGQVIDMANQLAKRVTILESTVEQLTRENTS
jgi:hypothetical protein